MVNLLSDAGPTMKDNKVEKPQEDIIFTVDDDIYEKVGVKRPRKGEEVSAMDGEKLYVYQLAQDKEKINKKFGTYADKKDSYHSTRMKEITYSTFHQVRPLGWFGDFNESANAARELSWRDTSKVNQEVFGIRLQKAPEIADKRYREWLTGKPKGPSKEYLTDKAQRKQDKELWENIKFARLEKTRDELREESKARSIAEAKARQAEKEAMKNKSKEKDKAASATAVKVWKRGMIEKNDFAGLRILPNKTQAYFGLKGWDEGHQNDWDYEGRGFAKTSQTENKLKDGERMSHTMVRAGDLDQYEGVTYSSGDYFRPGDELDREYLEYIVDLNYKKAVFYLAEAKKVMRKRQKAEKKAAAIEKMNRKRTTVLVEADLAMDALQAKTIVAVNSGAFRPAGLIDDDPVGDDDLDDEEKAMKKEEERLAREKAKLEEEIEERDREELAIDQALWLLERQEVDERDEVWEVPSDTIDWASMSIVQKKKMEIELRNPLSLANIVRKLKLLAGHVTVNNVGIIAKKTTRIVVRGSKIVAYQLHPHTVKRRVRYMSKCRCLKAVPILPETEAEAEAKGGEHGKRKRREWEKYTEEELEALDSKDRRRLKAMREKDLMQDEAEKKEAQGAESRAAAIVRKKAKEVEARKMRNPFFRAYRMIFGAPAAEMSDLERRRAEAKKNKERLTKEEANEEKAMEMLFLIREKQRDLKGAYSNFVSILTGKESGASTEEYSPDDLIRFSRMGNYNAVIDILDHLMSPVGPNQVNADGDSAFSTVLEMTLMNEAAESGENYFDTGSIGKRILRYFRKKQTAGKIDLVLKVLAYKGGDINFVREDKDADGEGVLHKAAHHGGHDMITWLHRKGADFALRTSQLHRTPLMYAARANKVDTVMQLLKLGSMISINAQDEHGWTALHFACGSASPELVTVLLICGADQYLRNNRGTLAIDEAMGRQSMAVVEAIRTFKKPDLAFRQQLKFMEIHYLDGMKEEAPELNEEEEEEEEVEEVGEKEEEGGGGDHAAEDKE